jgi:AcrR family transcriptional regulator
MTATSTNESTPRLRADASRNRARIITAAREAFVEFGADVPLDEIARRAGVGNATLYRNFADRRVLIHHVTLSVMAQVIDHAEAAMVEEADAFTALTRFTHAAADERIGALCPLLSDYTDRDDPELEAARILLEQVTGELVARAHASGQLRPDVGVGDFIVAIAQLTRPLPGSTCLELDRDHFAHRHLQLFLDGLQAPARSELPGRAATMADLKRRS